MKADFIKLVENYEALSKLALELFPDKEQVQKEQLEYFYYSGYNTIIKSNKISYAKQFTKELGDFWSYLVAEFAEDFWEEVENRALILDRIDYIAKRIKRNKFLNSSEARMCRDNWPIVKNRPSLQAKHSPLEISKIDELIKVDFERRLTLLRKSLKNRRVNWSDYINYGAALGYFTNGKLFEKNEGTPIHDFFTFQEQEILQEIWALNEPQKK